MHIAKNYNTLLLSCNFIFIFLFFHNINEVFNVTNKELVLKNLYLGLSRASFYLGVTSAQKSEELSFLDEVFESDKLNWQI